MLPRTLALLLFLAGAVAGVRAQLAQTQHLEAEIAFLEARAARDDADPITPTRLGHAYLRQARGTGDFTLYGRAEAAFEQALARAPDHIGALTGLGTARAAAHRFREALEIGERAIALSPEAPDGYAVAGDAALELGMLDRAAEMYGAVARLAPGYYADTRLANLAAARGEPRVAYAALARAESDASRRELSAELRAWCFVRAGSIAFDVGDWARAERSYTTALRLTPDSAPALEHLAELRAAQGRRHESLALYAKAISASAQPEFHEAVGHVHRAAGRPHEAEQAFARARQDYLAAAEAGDPGAFRPLALFYADVERNPGAAVIWARRDLERRQDAVTLGVLAWALLQDGQRAEAAATAMQAVDRRPADAMTWYRVGVVAMETGDVKAARTRLTRALQINPKFAEAAEARRRVRELRR